MTQSGQNELRSPGKLSTGSNVNQRSLYVVGLEREGGGGEGQVISHYHIILKLLFNLLKEIAFVLPPGLCFQRHSSPGATRDGEAREIPAAKSKEAHLC